MIADEQLSTMSLSELRELQDKLSKRIQGLVNAEKQEAIITGIYITIIPYL